MTGGEIVPVAAQAAASVAKKAVDDKDDKSALQGLATESPNMKAAAESYARRVAIKQAVLLKVYQPLARFLGLSREYFDTGFHEDMAKKVTGIPDEHLVTPSPSVAIPAMQGLGYSFEEPDLKEMYLSLLATATDDRVSSNAHPSFAEVIRQLSPGEATLLLETLRAKLLPAVRVSRKSPEGEGGVIAFNYLLPLHLSETNEPKEESSLPVWIDNWIRLGLIEVDYMRSFVDEGRYSWVHERPEFLLLIESDPRGREGFDIERGVLRTTDFGSRFLAAVSYDGVGLDGAPGLAEVEDGD
ncbi:DUF4393 domain-containing protein [Blastococcus sp. CT_GayMR20]|uniref:DUF4393 domain-containing protein n=1 Tax=Blastococcus sp. CT_GayMR20 TaxID=2559609 RepID=UPI00142F4368|nr:DUF4393 domain-containing protein [Blastococcus sp. CT_GayMR20]